MILTIAQVQAAERFDPLASGMSTAAVSSGPLLDRGDIDKSCKFLENIVSIFYEYCQLAQSITATHRKLAKALKEAASVKGASEFPCAYMLIKMRSVI